MKNQLRLEDYPAIADFIFTSFERDLSEFTAIYKTMDATYLSSARSANISLKTISANLIAKQEKKDATAELYAKADLLKNKIILLKDYAQRGKISADPLSDCVYKLSKRNIEGALLVLRDAFPYYQQNVSLLVDMPDGFLATLFSLVNEVDALNNAQNTAINRAIANTAASKEAYRQVYQYITDIAKAGKIIFAKTPKADEYTIWKLLTRVRAAQKRDEKGEPSRQQ